MNMKKFLITAGICLALAVTAQAQVRVSMQDALKNAVSKPTPEYNPIARQMRIAGDVEVEVRIDESGSVESVKVVRGNAMLTQSVVETVKKWKFTPFTANGAPSPAVANLLFTFKL